MPVEVADPADLNEEETALMAEMEEDDGVVVSEGEAEDAETLTAAKPEKVEPEPEKVEAKVETTVPLGALDSERHKRKEAESRIAVLEAQFKELSQPKQEEPVEDKMPDPVIDQSAFEAWMQRRDARMAQPIVAMAQQQHAQTQQAQHFSELRQFAAAGEASFRVEKTDYDSALKHAQDMKGQEFRNYGFPEDQIPALVAHAEAGVATLARERGVNPAKIVYEYAMMTGYKQAAPEASESDKMAKLKTTQAQTRSTATAGGTARDEEYTIEKLASMSEADLAALPDSVIEGVMGA